MNKGQLVSVVIPAYNEGKIISETITHITTSLDKKKINYELIIIENGSRDKTAEIATYLAKKDNRIKVFSQTLGNYGLALRRGMEESTGEIIINFDADYYDLEFVTNAITLLHSPQEYDIIIASKHLKNSKDERSIFRRIISKSFNIVLLLITGLKVSDTHGIKAWRNTPLLRAMMRKTKGISNVYDTELILRMQRNRAKIKEIPIWVRELRRTRSGIIKRTWTTIFEIKDLVMVLLKE